MHIIAFLPWFKEMNVGLAELALKMHGFSACVNGVSQPGLASQKQYFVLIFLKRQFLDV